VSVHLKKSIKLMNWLKMGTRPHCSDIQAAKWLLGRDWRLLSSAWRGVKTAGGRGPIGEGASTRSAAATFDNDNPFEPRY
jgi:hypothetical protein